MADFKKAIGYTLKCEGGYSNDPDDAGRETYCGISRVSHPNWAGWEKVDAHRPLKWNEVIDDAELARLVEDFYLVECWKGMCLDEVTDQNVAGFIFDWHVNSGGAAIKAVQRLVKVTDDGVMGPHTVEAINASDPARLFAQMKMTREAFYRNLVVVKPGNAKFLGGWLARVQNFPMV